VARSIRTVFVIILRWTNSNARRQEHSDSLNRIVHSNMTFFHFVEVNVSVYLGAPRKIENPTLVCCTSSSVWA
jgi:hypothetical protein